jgi:hypothetical protein
MAAPSALVSVLAIVGLTLSARNSSPGSLLRSGRSGRYVAATAKLVPTSV